MNSLLLALLLALAPVHDLHASYATAVVEGPVLAVRIRFFRDDLEAALARHAGRPAWRMSAEPETEAAFLAYFRTRFTVEVGGEVLAPAVVGSGEDELDREPVWWYAIQFAAPSPLRTFRVRNVLLTELFHDQTNLVKFVRFPDQAQKTYSFSRGEESFQIQF